MTLNDTKPISVANDVNFLYGDATLEVQECALISFDIDTLKINKSNEVRVNITTDTTATTIHTFNAIVDNNLYNITISSADSSADLFGDLIIKTTNGGTRDLNIDSVYINGTYFNINDFSLGVGESLDLEPLDSVTLTIPMSYVNNTLIIQLGIPELYSSDELEVLVRTKEGAEDMITLDIN